MTVFIVLSIIYILINYIIIGPILWYHFSKIRTMIKSIEPNEMESISDNDGAPSTNNNNDNNNNCNDNYIYNLIQVRSPTFIYIISMISFIGIFIERPLLCIVRVLQFNIIPIWLSRAFGVLFMGAMLFLFAIKSYHLYFKQKYNLTISEIAWRININPNEFYNNWYYKNNKRYGNVKWLIKIACIPYFILIIFEMIQVFYGNEIMFVLIHLIFLSFPSIVTLIVFIKLHSKDKIKDIYKLHDEMKYQLYTLYILTFIYVSFFITMNIIKPVENNMMDSNTESQIKWLFTCCSTTWIFIFPCTLINLKYPLIILNRYESGTGDIEKSINITTTELDTNHLQFIHKLSMGAMKHCLSDYDGYKLFMEHLVQEFACENLLFLTGIISICLQKLQRKSILFKNEIIIDIYRIDSD